MTSRIPRAAGGEPRLVAARLTSNRNGDRQLVTLREFLALTGGLPRITVRAAMVRAISDLQPERVLDRDSYARFYRAVLGRLNGSLLSAVAPSGSAAGHASAVTAARARGRRHMGCSGVRPRAASNSDALGPYRHLAVRVIDQALRDLASPDGSTSDRESARVFLAGSPMLYHWCEVAELDPRWVIVRLRMLPVLSD